MRARGSRGQVVALYAIALPVLLGVVALALDGGKLFVSKVHVQNTADAAALASAQDLAPCPMPGGCPDPATESAVRLQVEADVNNYSSKNGGPTVLLQCAGDWFAENASERHIDPARDPNDPTGCYTWPYINSQGVHWDQVEVRIRKPANLEFAHLVGFTNPAYPFARAVGTYTIQTQVIPGSPGSPTTVVFTTDPDTVVAGQTHTTTTVIDGTTLITTTVTPGQTHTTTNVTGGSCSAGGNCGVAFAKSEACNAIVYGGAGGGSIGSLMTNGGFQGQGASGKTIDTLFLGKYAGHEDACYGNGGRVTFAHPIVGPFSPQNWPIPPPNPPTPVPIGQTLTGNQCWDLGTSIAGQVVGFTANTTSRKPGIYCLSGSGTLSLSKSANGYTFFAPCITVSGNGGVFHYAANIPASQGGRQQTLFYASATDATCGGKAISMQGQDNTVTGDVFAPFGGISWQGGGVTGGSGFMEAQTFNIQGNFASYQGTGPFQGSSLTTVTTTDPDTTVVNTTVTGATTNYGTSTDNSTTVSGQTRPIFTSPGTPSTPASTQTTGTGSGLGE